MTSIIIYEIYGFCEGKRICYIGSTSNSLKMRMHGHKSGYNAWLKDESNTVSIYPYFLIYGFENFDIHELERCSLEERFIYEQKWIESTENINNVNAIYMGRSQLEAKYREEQRFYCYDCEKSFGNLSVLKNHYVSETHWKVIFPTKLEYNMTCNLMSWEKVLKKEEQRIRKNTKQAERCRTDEMKQKKQQYYIENVKGTEARKQVLQKYTSSEKGRLCHLRYRTSEKAKITLATRRAKDKDEKRFSCEICEISFCSNQKLKLHLTREIHFKKLDTV